jgi:hypothetical protein
MRSRAAIENAEATATAETKAEPTTTVAKQAEPAVPAPVETQAAATAQPAPTEPHPAELARATQGDGVNAPVLPSKPTTTVSNAAASTARYEAAKATMRGDKPESAPKPESTASDKTSAPNEKVVLAEEPSSDDKGEAPAEESKPPFDTGAAKAALEAASASASSCKTDDGPTGRGKVQVTFSPTGRATSANVIEGPFGGTSVGGCIAKVFRGAKVPAFSGDAVTVSKSFTIPE